MEKMDEKDFEIDFAELFNYFKSKRILVLGVTVAITCIVSFYMFFLNNYRYSYTGVIECPRTMDYATRLGYTNQLKDDIERANLWDGDKKAKLTNIELVHNTYLIKLKFKGEDPEYLKIISDNYINEATERINKRFLPLEEKRYSELYLKLVLHDLEYISATLSNETTTANGSIKFLERLKTRLEIEEKEKNILKAESIIDPNNEVTEVNKTLYIFIGALIGFFIVTGCIICQYCWRKLKE